MTRTLLSLGHGYTAQALARRLIPDGWRIIGTTRHAGGKTQAGVEMHLWPGADPAPLVARASHILISIAPGEDGDPVLAAHPGLFCDAKAEWAGYLSTTVVYGDHQGGWVDEGTPLTPGNARGRQRVLAEDQWRVTGLPMHIFRLAGIYGPGRGPFEKVRDGSARRVIKAGQVFSRTHVDDIAQVLQASMTAPRPGTAYNVCDDDPAPPQDVIAYAAELLGLPIPPAVPIEEANLTPMGASFYAESKRVRNDRIKRDLGVRLLYPTYREGLAALLQDDRT
jgi:nucleoside-diphosphate-sugar epimerase